MPPRKSTTLQFVPSPAGLEKRDLRKPASVRQRPIRVCLLEFDPMRATGLQAAFENSSEMSIVVENASTRPESAWHDPRVEVAVVGTRLGAGTLKLIATIRAARPDLYILVMSPAAGNEAVLNVLNLGAKGFLHESTTAVEFRAAVRSVVSGCIWAPRRIQAELIDRLLLSRNSHASATQVRFTAREQEVLNLLLDGQSNREIARSLKIEERTVKSYVAKLMRKTGVSNRTALSMYAMSAQGRKVHTR